MATNSWRVVIDNSRGNFDILLQNGLETGDYGTCGELGYEIYSSDGSSWGEM